MADDYVLSAVTLIESHPTNPTLFQLNSQERRSLLERNFPSLLRDRCYIEAADEKKATPGPHRHLRGESRKGSFRIDERMSGYYYPATEAPEGEEDFEFTQPFQMQGAFPQQIYHSYNGQLLIPSLPQRQMSPQMPHQIPHQMPQQIPQQIPQPMYQPSQQYPQQFHYPSTQAQDWVTPTVPSNYPYEPQAPIPFPSYSEPPATSSPEITAGPSRTSTGYLSPDEVDNNRASRSASFASNTSSISLSDVSRSVSPNASEMAKWGFKNQNGTWSCAYPGCASRSTFNRGCDLRKHYKRHTKSLFCRYDGCPQATEGGFSSKKDRARHEAKHNPNISCEWEGCDRMFSRVDNMKDHVRRVHKRK